MRMMIAMILMMAVMITIIVASSPLPMLLNATVEMYIRTKNGMMTTMPMLPRKR